MVKVRIEPARYIPQINIPEPVRMQFNGRPQNAEDGARARRAVKPAERSARGQVDSVCPDRFDARPERILPDGVIDLSLLRNDHIRVSIEAPAPWIPGSGPCPVSGNNPPH